MSADAAVSSPREVRSVDPQVWKACAGSSARIPAIGSRACYFPQGHAEQAASPPDFSALPAVPDVALCRISAVRLLADTETDEVFSSISLDPRPSVALSPSSSSSSSSPPEVADGGDGFVSFAKILTPSDANNGGGFSVPRFCADLIFPPLDFNADPPVQTIWVCDVHGSLWDFRHIYRGTPRRHLLTTGWSKFVNSKKLIAGDSVVFMKNQSGKIFVGVRRTSRSCGPVDHSPYIPQSTTLVTMTENFSGSVGFSRNVRGRVPAASVVEAVRLAGMGLPFEVLYYPRAGSPEFVVAEETVEAAMRVRWTSGMRVRMSLETEDSARMTWFQGTLSSLGMNDVEQWPRSPWRMLKVNWDEPEVLQNVKNVSPWQVDLVSVSSQMETPFSVIRNFKMPENSEFLGNSTGKTLQMTGTKSKSIGSVSPFFSYIVPAGMQGARHDSISIPHLCDSAINRDKIFIDGPHGVSTLEKNDVSVDQRIGTTSLGGSSQPSQDSIQVLDRRILETRSNPVKKPSTGSFQLFGQVIHIDQPTNDDNDRKYEDTEGDKPGSSLSNQHKQLVVQCPRVSAVGACQ
ncbi:auxin response factor 17 [Musa acuminata AAA Group]|uniref:auxin response factor 17 n=1 Tax=Musa acuminata AAA Group TaxID=214697 RepID=UPI0031DCAF2C